MTTQTAGIDWNGILANVGTHLNDWINTLAHSLGVAANFLMGMEIKQMYICGFNRALWALAGIIVMTFLISIFRKIRKKCSNNAEYARYVDGQHYLLLIPIFATVIFNIWAVTSAVGHFINPAHYALYDIINQINQLRNGNN